MLNVQKLFINQFSVTNVVGYCCIYLFIYLIILLFFFFWQFWFCEAFALIVAFQGIKTKVVFPGAAFM